MLELVGQQQREDQKFAAWEVEEKKTWRRSLWGVPSPKDHKRKNHQESNTGIISLLTQFYVSGRTPTEEIIIKKQGPTYDFY